MARLGVSLLQDQNRIQNRMEKVLEDAHLKLGSVASDTLGVSGRKIIRAVIAGNWDAGWRLITPTVRCARSASSWSRLCMVS